MFDPDDFDLVALDDVIESYDYETDPLLKDHFHHIETNLCAQIESYGEGVNDYGRVMMAHLRRTSEDGRDFLIYLGFSEKAGHNFYHANLLQDLGKIHPAFDVELWSLPYRPSPEQKAEKREHVHRGPEIFGDAVQDAVQDTVQNEMEVLFNHPHISLMIPAIQMFHHERVDGKGTYSKTGKQMGRVIKAACIVDAKDGDMMKRAHQDHERTEDEALERMQTADKYDGAFDDLLERYIQYRSSL